MKNAIKILGILFFISTIMSCGNNENDKNAEADYEVSADIAHEQVIIQQQNADFGGSKLQFECNDYKAKFNGSSVVVILNTSAIKSEELDGILTTENYLNAKDNPALVFEGEASEASKGDFQYVANGKMKTKSLTLSPGSIQLVFNFNEATQKLEGELRFVKPEHFEGIEGSAIGIKLN
jgi:polyisoprenoid-binding protein YceI